MVTAPYGFRLLVGAATAAVEETVKLPRTVLMYPMTLVSQAAHIVMRMQQNLAELVNKGDATLEMLFPPRDEQPEWATFDEDLADDEQQPGEDSGGPGDDQNRSAGRFALYSQAGVPAPAGGSGGAGEPTAIPTPAVVGDLDYDSLTLAQLRARLQSLDVGDLEALLTYEEATKARAPFQTLLANRITRASAK